MVEEVRYELGEWAKSEEAAVRLQKDTLRGQREFTIAAIVKQCEDVVKRHEVAMTGEYLDDGAFRALVGEMLDTKAWDKEKKQLWMMDVSSYIRFLRNFSHSRGFKNTTHIMEQITATHAPTLHPSQPNACILQVQDIVDGLSDMVGARLLACCQLRQRCDTLQVTDMGLLPRNMDSPAPN
jgi:hypothetical protein